MTEDEVAARAVTLGLRGDVEEPVGEKKGSRDGENSD